MRLIFCLAFLTLAAPALSAEPAAVMQQRYSDFLKSQRLPSEVDSDGDVRFQRAFRGTELSYFIDVDPEDPQYFAIVLPNIWSFQKKKERLRVLRAMDLVNGGIKVTKASLVGNNVWLSVELFVSEPDGFAPLFERSLSALDDATELFLSEM
jgi:hypothetical protein